MNYVLRKHGLEHMAQEKPKFLKRKSVNAAPSCPPVLTRQVAKPVPAERPKFLRRQSRTSLSDLLAPPSARRRGVRSSPLEAKVDEELRTGDTSEGTDTENEVRADLKRQKVGARRLKKYWRPGVAGDAGSSSVLEEQSVSAACLAGYKTSDAAFRAFCGQEELAMNTASLLDAALVAYFHHLFFGGWESYRGDRLLAAIMCLYPRFSRGGDLALPRARRALGGWRRLVPQRSRVPHAVFVVSAIIAHMASKGEVAMAIYCMLCFVTYSRPGSMLALRRSCVLEPVPSIGNCWQLLLHPSCWNEKGKTGTQDDHIVLDNSEYKFLSRAMPFLRRGPPDAHVFAFTYPAFVKVVREASAYICVPFVPYQLRHSGASWDVARSYRSTAAVQKRGLWKCESSMARYEKHGRMMAEYQKLPQAKRRWMEAVHADLEKLFSTTGLCHRLEFE